MRRGEDRGHAAGRRHGARRPGRETVPSGDRTEERRAEPCEDPPSARFGTTDFDVAAEFVSRPHPLRRGTVRPPLSHSFRKTRRKPEPQETSSRNQGAGTGPIACTPFVHAGSISSAWRRWVHGEACIESRRIDLPCGMAIAGSRERGITASPSVARITERGARTSPSMGRTAYRKMRRRELPSGILFSGRLVSWAWPRCAELPSPSLPCSVGRCLPPLR